MTYDIRLDTKVAVYTRQPTCLLYSTGVSRGSCISDTSQSWSSSTSVAWRIAHVKWQDHIGLPNTEVLQICSICGIEAFLIPISLDRTRHIIRVSHNRLPKQAFYSQLEHGTRAPVMVSGRDTRTC